MRYTRYVALHPLRGSTPERKRCNADGSGAPPPTTTTTARNSCPHALSGSPRRSHTAARCSPQQRVSNAAETKQERHPLRCATPDTWRCTRYGAVHPNGRGVMPTDRVQCPHDKSKSRLPCANSLTTVLRHCHAAVENSVEHRAVPTFRYHRPEHCLCPHQVVTGRADARQNSVIEVKPASQDSLSHCRWARPPQRTANTSHRSFPARAYRSPVRLTPLPTPARCSSHAR